MRVCSKCHLEKPDNEFNKKGKGRLQGNCKDCNKLMLKKHYLNNKQYYKDKANRRYEEARDFLETLKLNLKCEECGENHPATLDFHHLLDKEINIALAPANKWSIKRIEKEIRKCKVLCSNCHRKLHWEEKHTSVV